MTKERYDDFQEVLKFVMKEPELNLALDDLISTLNYLEMTSANCGRVIENIKELISPKTKSPADAWKKMQEELNISLEYQIFITQNSQDKKHGKKNKTELKNRAEVRRRTWTIMNRYFEYLKGEKKKLTEPDFQLLK